MPRLFAATLFIAPNVYLVHKITSLVHKIISLVHKTTNVPVFLYGAYTVYAEKPDRLNTQIKNDARQRVFVVGQ